MNVLEKSLDHSRAIVRNAHTSALRMKDAGMLGDIMAPASMGMFGDWGSQVKNRQGYAAFSGWLYAAVNALAQEAAGQPVNLARLLGVESANEEGKRSRPGGTKAFSLGKMTSSMRRKAAEQEMEVVVDHPLLESLEHPNPFQGRWQFVYSFVANLNLTGWAYIVAGDGEKGTEFYSLPTTWIRPDHSDGPFSKFWIVNPKDGKTLKEPLTREQVAFAHLPDPSNPQCALAPATSQMAAIRIDDHIQTSQERFFRNGIFPSVVITVGKNPHPDVPGGIRPRLTVAQRRQITGVINRTWSGVANYGAPAIVDGMVESVTRLSSNQNEMGWDKSEDKVRTRILSAFAVHPYILGEPVGVGGYAQVANIEKRFYKRVNTLLDMLSTVMSNFVGSTEGDERLMVWWEECKSFDPQLRSQQVQSARAAGDISQNELRAELGFPPDEDRNESTISPSNAGVIIQLMAQVGAGAVGNEQAAAIMVGMGLPTDLAEKIAGQASEKKVLEQATEELQAAVRMLKSPPQMLMAEMVLPSIKFDPDQPRDEQGQWSEGSSGEGEAGEAGEAVAKIVDKWQEMASQADYNSQRRDADGTVARAFETLPKHKGVVYRGLGLKQKEIDRMVVGSTIKIDMHSSASKEEKFARPFALFSSELSGGRPVLLEVKVKNAADISSLVHGQNRYQKEVVLVKGMKFRVAEVTSFKFRAYRDRGVEIDAQDGTKVRLEQI